MPQGKVIAVKPQGYATNPSLMFARSAEADEPGLSGGDVAGNLVYIEVFKKNDDTRRGKKVDTVVWYIDNEGELEQDDYVELDINHSKTRPIKGAENVKKIRGKVYLPGDLLSKVVLLASVLLIFSVVLDKER